MSQLNSPQQAQDPDALYHLCYVSTAAVDFSDEALVALLDEARSANTDRDVTGLLLYREGSFYQVLEGSESAVKATFQDIEEIPATRRFAFCLTARPTPESSLTGNGVPQPRRHRYDTLSGFSDFMTRDADLRSFWKI